MPARELGEWRHYLQMDPRGEDVNAALLAQLCSLVASAFHDPKASRKPPTPDDFLAGLYPDRKRGKGDPATWTDRQRETWHKAQAAKMRQAAQVMKAKAEKGKQHGNHR